MLNYGFWIELNWIKPLKLTFMIYFTILVSYFSWFRSFGIRGHDSVRRSSDGRIQNHCTHCGRFLITSYWQFITIMGIACILIMKETNHICICSWKQPVLINEQGVSSSRKSLKDYYYINQRPQYVLSKGRYLTTTFNI